MPAPSGYSWNCDKYEINKGRHDGLAFDDAIYAFLDPFGFDFESRIEGYEGRWSWLGLHSEGVLLYISYAMYESDTVTHVISARRATRSERRAYHSR